MFSSHQEDLPFMLYTCFRKTYLGVGSRVSYFTSVPSHFNFIMHKFEKQSYYPHGSQEWECLVRRILKSKNDTASCIWLALATGVATETHSLQTSSCMSFICSVHTCVDSRDLSPERLVWETGLESEVESEVFPKYPLFVWYGYVPSPIFGGEGDLTRFIYLLF